ncbi:DNA-3-methyladenine glycosylase [Tomitella fengzijianii]|uniref:Putative 3-methyladenine DNA glycosylase n=1 Tax=Tomitella fengzijianii TaxID=2597660 RepID=A0A516X875_9ACTN|nr:DNA-3-methyladenine glycosylase [Tomitella fengzijianii]
MGGEAARAILATEPLDAARALLGAHFTANGVTVRIVEVEAYRGSTDPASHAYRGPTPRNRVMFGPAGHLYVYRSYGIHTCMNVSAGLEGAGWAVLLRAGEVTEGQEVAAERRPSARTALALGRGPGNLGRVMGIGTGDGGADLLAPGATMRLTLPAAGAVDAAAVHSGPRVGVSVNADVPWRLWLRGSPAVSAYRRSPRADPPRD